MMKLPHAQLVSVIVPVYNVERYLQECVSSILTQTYRDIELILVDDGSRDGSSAIADRIGQSDDRVKVIHQQNQGQSAARNAGLDIAAGEWVMFVDSDDMFTDPDAVALAVELGQTNDADMVVCPLAYAPGKQTAPYKVKTLTGHVAAESMLYQTADPYGLQPSPCAKLIRRLVFKRFSFQPGTLYEDLLLLPQLTASLRKVVVTNHPVYFYRDNPESTLCSFSQRRYQALSVCEALLEHFSSDEQLAKAAADRLLSASFNQLLLMGQYGVLNEDVERRAIQYIRQYRMASLLNPKVRMRNKAGVILSLLLGIRIFRSGLFTRFLRK